MRTNSRAFLLLGIVLATAATFSGVLTADFVAWDDDLEVFANPHLTGLGVRSLRWMFLEPGYVVRYQPFTWLTWNTIVALFGVRAAAFHAANLLFHCANAALVFVLIEQLLRAGFSRRERPVSEPVLLLCAAWGALFWALHPLRVEPVAWVSAFLHCQALFFLLVAAVTYLRAAAAATPARFARRLYWTSVLSFLVSLLSYPVGIGFIFVPIVFDLFVLRRLDFSFASFLDGTRWRIWLEKLPFLLAAGVVLGITLLLRYHVGAEWPKPPTLAEFGLLPRLMQASYMWIYCLWRHLWPLDPAPVYTTFINFDPLSPPFVSSLVLVVLLTWLFLRRLCRTHPGLAAGWLCHLILLGPVLGLTERPHFPSDRYSLLSAIVLSALLAASLLVWSEQASRRLAIISGAAGILVLCAFLSASQVRVWHNSLSLFTHTIGALGNDPYRSDIYLRLGIVLEGRKETDRARLAFLGALEANPANQTARWRLAQAESDSGLWTRARSEYLKLLESQPANPTFHNSLGVTEIHLGQLAAAANSFSNAARLDPGSAVAQFNFGLALQQLGRTNESRRHLENAEKLRAGTAARP